MLMHEINKINKCMKTIYAERYLTPLEISQGKKKDLYYTSITLLLSSRINKLEL